MASATFPRSGILLFGANSIHAVVASSLITRIETLLASHKIPEALTLADSSKQSLQQKQFIEEPEAQELSYIYQRIGFQCFSETRFEEAGQCFLNGDLDPRVLVSYYPELAGSLLSADDNIMMFSGIKECMPTERSVEDLIIMNLVRNYSPHLAPNTRSAPPTTELRKIYLANAQDMLERFLKEQRVRRRPDIDSNPNTSKHKRKVSVVDIVIDTVLAKLYAKAEKTEDLYRLLQGPHDVDGSDIEDVLKASGQYNALCMIYKQLGDNEKLLEAWSQIADGKWSEEDIQDPLGEMITLLERQKDRSLVQKWALWMTSRDMDRGLKLLTARETGKRRDKSEDDKAILQELQELNPAAGSQYLEHLVLQKRNTSQDLHTQLALACIQQVLSFLEDTSISKLWRAKASSYASSPNEMSFVSYFLATTPDSESKRARLKTIIFLQTSAYYDPSLVREKLLEQEKMLKIELAIVEGKMGNHKVALTTLVHDIQDSVSAKMYCMLGGDILPPRTVQSIGEECSIQQWTALALPQAAPGSKSSAAQQRMPKQVDERTKEGLSKLLLQVYLAEGNSGAHKAAQLLNSQATHMDILEAIQMIPEDWPLALPLPFLASSLRRIQHRSREGRIVKTIASAHNLKVAEDAWLVLREQGYDVEEEDSDEDEEKGAGVLSEKTSASLSEKPQPPDVVEIFSEKDASSYA